jgi:tetratricopeptide (TPR) repeat protein
MGSIETAEELYGKGDYLGSLSLVQKILDKEPDNLDALEMKGILCCIKSRLPEAIRTYKRLLKFYGSDEKVWAQLYILGKIGSSYRLLKDIGNAIIYYKKSIKLCERFLEIDGPHREHFGEKLGELFWTLGEYQYRSRDYSGAVDTYKKFLKLLPEFGCLETIADVLYDLACAYHKLNRITEALNKYSRALRIYDASEESAHLFFSRAKIHYSICTIRFGARDFEEALFHAERCLLFSEIAFERIGDPGDLGIVEDDPIYIKAKKLKNSLEKNKFL